MLSRFTQTLSMTEVVPEEVPIRPAATVLLIDDRPDLQVFMMKRHANTVFAGGMWVFPGGAVDHQDDASYFSSIATHRTDGEASELMNLENGGLAYYMAAIRETFFLLTSKAAGAKTARGTVSAKSRCISCLTFMLSATNVTGRDLMMQRSK